MHTVVARYNLSKWAKRTISCERSEPGFYFFFFSFLFLTDNLISLLISKKNSKANNNLDGSIPTDLVDLTFLTQLSVVFLSFLFSSLLFSSLLFSSLLFSSLLFSSLLFSE